MSFCYDHPRPSVTVDIVLFRLHKNSADVLLIRRARSPFKDYWAFPGGFVDQDEDLEAAAHRELEEETGISGLRLEQIGAFGVPGRDPRGHTVSIAFGAVLTDGNVSVRAADDAAEAGWFSIEAPPALAFDHDKILAAALDRFRESVGQG